MKKLMLSILALVAAVAFAGTNMAFSAESVSTTSPQQGQAQMTPEASGKTDASGKSEQAKTKKANKKAKKKAKKSRKAEQE